MRATPIVLGELSELRSRRVRVLNSQSLGGVRTIDITASSDGSNAGVTTGGGSGGGGISGIIGGALKKLANFLWAAAMNFISGNITRLFSALTASYLQLESFDWNSSDAEIKQQIEQNNEQLIMGSSDAMGQLAAWGLVGFANLVIGATLGAVGKATGNVKLRSSNISGIAVPVLSGRIAAALAEEGGEELRGELGSFLARARNTAVRNTALSAILSARKAGFLGGSITDDNLPTNSFLDKQQSAIKKYIPVKWQDYAEDFLDSFKDSLQDAIYVVTNTVDDYIAALKYNQSQNNQSTQSVTLVIGDEREVSREVSEVEREQR